MSKPPPPKKAFSLTIHDLGSSGEGVGYYNGYTVFVDGALPGETIEAELIDTRKHYGFAKLKKIITSSPDRISPPCKLFGICGGCQIMHLSYPKQLEIKRQKVVNALTRIGKITTANIQPCIPSPLQLSYRNKIQLPVQGASMGLYAKNSHDLIPLKNCQIHCSLGENVYHVIQQLLQPSHKVRHVLIKSAIHTQEALVVIVTDGKPTPSLNFLAHQIMETSPKVKGVVHNRHQGKENVILGPTYETLSGQGFIQERLCNLLFRVSPASFFQVNPLQAECLYRKALEIAEISPEDTVLDAYCGVGTLSLIFAKQAKNVIGVECVPEAIEDAQKNAMINQINNVSFVCAPAEDFITSLSSIDLVILNPPRKGCDPTFLKRIKNLAPKKIIYISCDPATLARDLAILNYFIDVVQPFDMFPQTSHVECIVKLTKHMA